MDILKYIEEKENKLWDEYMDSRKKWGEYSEAAFAKLVRWNLICELQRDITEVMRNEK